MTITTLNDVKAEIARHGIRQTDLAARLGLHPMKLSNLFTMRPLVDLTPAGAERMREAIESLSREAVAS